MRGKRPGPELEVAPATLTLDYAEDFPDDRPAGGLRADPARRLPRRPAAVRPRRRGRPAVAGQRPAARRPARGADLRAGLVGPADPAVGARVTDWPPIADHGLIGDLRTCALVGTDATIDWFCARPLRLRPASSAACSTPTRGSWTMQAVDGATTTQQFYLPDSNDPGHPVPHRGRASPRCTTSCRCCSADDPDHRQRLVRRVVGVRGTITRAHAPAPPDPTTAAPTPEITEVDGGLPASPATACGSG